VRCGDRAKQVDCLISFLQIFLRSNNEIRTKKYFAYLLIAVLFASFIFITLAVLIHKYSAQPSIISVNSFIFWEVGGIVLSLYAISTPWRWQNRFFSTSSGPKKLSPRRIKGFFILFGYIPLISPHLYGLALLFLGLPIFHYYYFAIISIAGTLTWSIYYLIKG